MSDTTQPIPEENPVSKHEPHAITEADLEEVLYMVLDHLAYNTDKLQYVVRGGDEVEGGEPSYSLDLVGAAAALADALEAAGVVKIKRFDPAEGRPLTKAEVKALLAKKFELDHREDEADLRVLDEARANDDGTRTPLRDFMEETTNE